MSQNEDNRRICLGAFAGAHGVKGDARIKTFTDAPENIAAYGPVESEDGARRFSLKVVKILKDGFALVRAPQITSREEAESLKGVRLYIERTALPEPAEDEFYLEDLVGLAAQDENGSPAGVIKAVYNFGADDLLEIGDIPNAKNVRLIPFTKEAVPGVNLDEGRIIVARIYLNAGASPTISDETGEIVSDDIEVDLAAMREEDA